MKLRPEYLVSDESIITNRFRGSSEQKYWFSIDLHPNSKLISLSVRCGKYRTIINQNLRAVIFPTLSAHISINTTGVFLCVSQNLNYFQLPLVFRQRESSTYSFTCQLLRLDCYFRHRDRTDLILMLLTPLWHIASWIDRTQLWIFETNAFGIKILMDALTIVVALSACATL
jgi:hypothetical protein